MDSSFRLPSPDRPSRDDVVVVIMVKVVMHGMHDLDDGDAAVAVVFECADNMEQLGWSTRRRRAA